MLIKTTVVNKNIFRLPVSILKLYIIEMFHERGRNSQRIENKAHLQTVSVISHLQWKMCNHMQYMQKSQLET
jgi:hypothetical protein